MHCHCTAALHTSINSDSGGSEVGGRRNKIPICVGRGKIYSLIGAKHVVKAKWGVGSNKGKTAFALLF